MFSANISEFKNLVLLSEGYKVKSHPELSMSEIINCIIRAQYWGISSEYGAFRAIISSANVTYIIGKVVIGSALLLESWLNVVNKIFTMNNDKCYIGKLRLLRCWDKRYNFKVFMNIC